jgi:hypothetical protein
MGAARNCERRKKESERENRRINRYIAKQIDCETKRAMDERPDTP